MPKPTAILRIKKLSSICAITASAGHTWRATSVPHADPERLHLNYDLLSAATPAALRKAVKDRLMDIPRRRKDAVLLIEYLITAGSFERNYHDGWEAYFKDALSWIQERHGKHNTLAANVQLDETCPHFVVYAMPVVSHPARDRQRNVITGRDKRGKATRENRAFHEPAHLALSANAYLGNRRDIAALQDRFYDDVGSQHGLVRGLEQSASRHVSTVAYQGALKEAKDAHLVVSPAEIYPLKQGVLSRESPEEVATRYERVIHDHYAPVVARAGLFEQQECRALEERKTALRHRDARHAAERELSVVREQLEVYTKGLSPAQIDRVAQYAQKLRGERNKQPQQPAQADYHDDPVIYAELSRMTLDDLVSQPHEWIQRAWLVLAEEADLDGLFHAALKTRWFHNDGRLTISGNAARFRMASQEEYRISSVRGVDGEQPRP